MADWMTPALLVGLTCGGLGGAVFTWWIKRDPAATLGYVVTTFSTGADPAVKSLVPELKLQIADRHVAAIHTHVIELTVTKGFSPSGQIAVVFDTVPVEVFGQSFVAPTPLHTLSAERIEAGYRCVMSPLDKNTRFRISLATSSAAAPALQMAGRDFRLESLADIAIRRDRPERAALAAVVLATAALGSSDPLRHLVEAIGRWFGKP